jgi:hypothetical protein
MSVRITNRVLTHLISATKTVIAVVLLISGAVLFASSSSQHSSSPAFTPLIRLSTAASAQTADTLEDFRGIWAHTAADCEAQLSGRLDEMPNATSSQYEVIGICEDGIDIFHQPVECSASQIEGQADRVEFLAACYVKDYPADKQSPATIINRGRGSKISLSINSESYSLSGNYLRCIKTYNCQHFRTRRQEEQGR